MEKSSLQICLNLNCVKFTMLRNLWLFLLFRNNRVLLNHVVVSSIDQELLINEIYECAQKYGVHDRINNIIITSKPLKKSKLGKVLRI